MTSGYSLLRESEVPNLWREFRRLEKAGNALCGAPWQGRF